jgi:hypothetical protein
MQTAVWDAFERMVFVRASPLLSGSHVISWYLQSDHDTGVFIPAQEWIVSVLCTRLCDIRPAGHEILVQVCAREATRYSGVHRFHDFKVGGEENVEVALMDLERL